MNKNQEWIGVTALLLFAALFRFGALGSVPPGLAHDEVANWLIARDILQGDHPIYFTAAYGHEPFYQYVQAATVALFGDHWLGLRYPSAALGLLGLAATYALIRRLFGIPTAQLTAGWLAVSFWPVFYARVALRAISLPLTAALFAYFLTRALDQKNRSNHRGTRSSWRNWLIAGFFLGASLYTYMAARILPVIALTISVYLLLSSDSMRRHWPSLLAMWATAAAVSAPLVLWLLAHPSAEYRIAEIQQPLTQLLTGNPGPVWQAIIANIKSFTISGDLWPRQNIPGRPVFPDVISAALFYAGLALVVWRWRTPRYGSLLIWLLGSLGPSVATSTPPSSIRNILALVVVFVLPARALVVAGQWLRGLPFAHSRRWLEPTLGVTAILPVAIAGMMTVHDYFWLWPQDRVVRFVYQSDLTAVARHLETIPLGTSVTIAGLSVHTAGLSVHTMDAPTLELSSRRETHDVRLCDTRETLVIPSGTRAELDVPNVVPFDEDLRQQILEWGAHEDTDSDAAFRRYDLASGFPPTRTMLTARSSISLADGTPATRPICFGGTLSFLGYRWLQTPTPGRQSATLLTYWQVDNRTLDSLKIFAHMVQENDTVIAQADGLASPSSRWAFGDLIIQKHAFSLPAPDYRGRLRVELGVYDSDTGVRLTTGVSDRLLVPALEATN